MSVAISNVFSGRYSLIRTQGCRNITKIFNPHERSNSSQDFTTTDEHTLGL